jgi:hypothetical protein
MKYSLGNGRPYKIAMLIVNELKREGIAANITAGGIAIYPEPKQIETMNKICFIYGEIPRLGLTEHQEDVIYGKDGGCK